MLSIIKQTHLSTNPVGGRLLLDKEPSRFTGSLTENNGV